MYIHDHSKLHDKPEWMNEGIFYDLLCLLASYQSTYLGRRKAPPKRVLLVFLS